MGHGILRNPVPGGTTIPAVQFKTDQTDVNGTFDSSVAFGIDLISDYVKDDNIQYLSPIPVGSGTGSNVTMSLEDQDGNDNASVLGSTFSDASEKITLSLSALGQRKFVVPFQFGFDGQNPAREYKTGTNIVSNNTMGFDLSSGTASGSVAYKRAINAISNPDEFDINLLATPGVVHRLHSSVTNHAISKIEARADAMYIMDAAGYDDTIQSTINTIKTLDTNYAATYYPWVKMVPRDTSRPIWVPPSVVIPGVIANTDRVAHEWFAPAGLNRGGLTSVTEAKMKLTHAERDDLYENRINPIATFPAQGVVVFGQKTLQSKPSALDRINVRRLLIALRKFIASSSRFLVFEQNNQALRNRFLNIVNPYLEQVQANSGLSAFRVVMDDSNNTPDVVDRNQLVGQIFIQPTRTAEFIVLDFVVQPTGATFPE
jgi:phage tail sheath protein FI